MYRAVAWKALQEGLDLDNDAQVSALAARADLAQDDGTVWIDGHDVTRDIRTPQMDQAAARVARLVQVREVLVQRQRALGVAGGVVMEGRDIGTVVFPDAHVKLYLDASVEERARRRASDEAHTGGQQAGVAQVQRAMAARDESDTTRSVAPLQMAADAEYVDTTALDAEAVFGRVKELVEARLSATGN